MINEKIDELFQAIQESKEYKAYQNIGSVLDNDKEIKKLVSEIKELQQKSVRLEEAGNEEYKEIDKLIDEKVSLLNSKPVYQEYLRRINEFNDILSSSSNQIEKYINGKIQN